MYVNVTFCWGSAVRGYGYLASATNIGGAGF